MARNDAKFFWLIVGMLLCISINIVSSGNILYPDSYELYSYKEPRSMNDLKNKHMRQAMLDVTETINEVQKILRKDPKLPRLTRGEIEDLFEMVTREEYKRSLAAGDYERAKHMRSLMLVLPFNTNNYSEERLEELFTQPPVTKMVNGVAKPPKPQRIILPASAENIVGDMIGAHSGIANQRLPTTFKPNFPTNMNSLYTAPVTTFHPKGNVQSVPTMLYPQGTLQTIPTYSQQTPAQMMSAYPRPKVTMQSPISSLNPKSNVGPVPTIFNPKVTSNYNPKTTAQISTFHPKTTIQSIASNAIPTNFISTYHPKTNPYKTIPYSEVASSQSPITTTTQSKYSSRFNAQTTYFVTPRSVDSVTPTIRSNVKNLLATIGLEPDSNAIEINNEMSDMKQSSTKQTESIKRSSITSSTTTTTTTTTPIPTTTTTAKPVLTPELKELLQSFGLLTNEEAPINAPADPDEFHPIFPSSLTDESLSVSEFKPLPKSVTASDIKEKIDSSFEIKPDDFSSFKPLPIQETIPAKDAELETLLKTYGILEDDQTSKIENDESAENQNNAEIEKNHDVFEKVTEKIAEMSEIPEVNVEFLSPELRKVLGNIGVKNAKKNQIPTTTPKIIRRIDKASTVKASSSTAGVLPSSTMENDYQKLNYLLDTIKELDSLTANLTDEELNKLNLKNFNFSQDIVTNSSKLDPIYGIESDSSPTKNEVKRQTNSSEPTRIQLDITDTTGTSSSKIGDDLDDDLKLDVTNDSTTTGAPERKAKQDNLDDLDTDSDQGKNTESSTATTTTEETRNGSMSDLAESFGGNDGLDPVSEEPLPPPRKNGFYFFSDWNSFLEVGEDPDKVVVRFDPKIGDQTPFVQVKIP